ncbi:hypothetical protein BKE38_13305 [Pseudoroseomonas deserti]|uniref:Nif11 domain-containing protein n=1 Tax=Teichococcus deserti TaxID=1817963 RepID=A0A1V2H421_9PROT|nr:hypothetical protein [Pseudoroseomonas deserti]ONG53155.1 hypothetical protein BKE38_13305 [Pseudoroseomonas deserti]
MRPDDVMASFRQLFAEQPEAAAGLAGLRDLDAAAELLDRIGARHGIATSAAEIRSHVRRLREEFPASGELSVEALDGVSGGQQAGLSEFDFMLSCLGQPAGPGL